MRTLSLVMIARNEARAIARALSSVRHHVDQIIVLDTGSDDETVAIAKEAGANVFHFAWHDDFSAARNAALEHSLADWNLILDADEWIELGDWKALRAELDQGEAFIGHIAISSSFAGENPGQLLTASQHYPRVLPRGVRYKGAIHEQPDSLLPARMLPLLAAHDGYDDVQLKEKKGRNRALLATALHEQPGNAYLHYQAGKDYETYREYEPALLHYLTALDLAEDASAFRHDLVVRALFVLKKNQQHEGALRLADDEYDRFQDSADFFFALGDLYLDYASFNPACAADILPLVEISWQKCLSLGEHGARPTLVRGRGSYLAAENLAHFYGTLGDSASQHKYAGLAETMRKNQRR